MMTVTATEEVVTDTDEQVVTDDVEMTAEEQEQAAADEKAEADAKARENLAAKMKESGLGDDETDISTDKEPHDDAPEGDDKEDKDKPKGEKKEPEPLSAREREAARQLGYTEDDVLAMDPKGREVFERAGMKLRRAMSSLGNDRQVKTEPAADKSSTPAGEKAVDDGTHSFKPEEYGQRDSDELNSMRNRLSALEDNATKSQDKSVDAWFDALDEKIFADFGKGPTNDLDEDSNERLLRDPVITLSANLYAAAEATGSPITQEESLRAAMSTLHPGKTAEVERAKLKAADDARKKRRTTMPTNRRVRPSASTSAAERKENVRKEMVKAGMLTE